MFYTSVLDHTIKIDPTEFSSNLFNHIRETLISQVEGSCTPLGYIVTVLSIEEIGDGELQLSGEAEFKISYKCIVLNVKKDEVLLAVVNETNKMGVFASVGPITVFISNYQLPTTFSAIKKNGIIRLKVLGVKIEKGQLFAIGTINEDYLGVLSNY